MRTVSQQARLRQLLPQDLDRRWSLTVADYFTMYNEVAESAADEDLGSGGEMLLPI